MSARAAAWALTLLLAGAAHASPYDPVTPGVALAFPADRGAHPGHRIEWWYVTGHLQSARGPLGFQVTFFRVRNPAAEASPSRFAARQVVFAHAALADPAGGRLLHDQRSARELPPLVEARRGETHVRIDDWSLTREGAAYRTAVAGADFTLELTLTPTQPVMLQGDRGFSRKGAQGAQASYYYSEPQLRVGGRVTARGKSEEVGGVAWLDHEWSSEVLAAEASGWDWLGANLDDGGAVMAFRIRDRQGGTLWSSATLRERGDGPVTTVEGARVSFAVRRTWKSPRTGTTYPVALDVRIGERTWRVEPLMDDQELDARASTGTLYWEGAATVQSGEARGRAYLELTGYAERVPF